MQTDLTFQIWSVPSFERYIFEGKTTYLDHLPVFVDTFSPMDLFLLFVRGNIVQDLKELKRSVRYIEYMFI